MESNNSTSGGEAARWLSIAEKLLPARDLLGSKTFAIRARESDPKLELAEQILAIADTLIAGETRINNINQQHDWYAVLQLARLTSDTEIIASQYRRLALLLHPQKNKLPFADQAFKLVVDAWSVLSSPTKKALYDNEACLPDSAGLTTVAQKQQPFWKTPPKNPAQSNLPVSNESTAPVPSFWTACPYCFHLYEYARVYEDCTLRCQNCRRAFHALTIPKPPITGGELNKDDCFCCWGYFPLGFSLNEYEKAEDKMGSYNWTPFSPMFSCPVQPQNGAQNLNANKGKARVVSKPKAIIIDDDGELLMDVSEPSEDSDDDWGSTKSKKKKVKNTKAKAKSPASKIGKKAAQAERLKRGNQNVMEQVFGVDFESMQGGSVMQEDLGVENVTKGAVGKKGVGSSSRKQIAKRGNNMGKLDLNVEFSNEVEETATRTNVVNRTRNGEEDNIEGIGFFEGLDEFLSSLPILSVVGDDKGKAS